MTVGVGVLYGHLLLFSYIRARLFGIVATRKTLSALSEIRTTNTTASQWARVVCLSLWLLRWNGQ